MLRILKQPYPLESSVRRIITGALFTGLFVGLFLAVYQPFGLSEWEHPHKITVMLLYGAITTFVMLVFGFIPRFFPHTFNEDNWNVGKAISWSLLMIFFIALGNLVYSNRIGIVELGWKGFAVFTAYTLALAVFPVTVMIIVIYNRLLNRYEEKAREANAQLTAHPVGPATAKSHDLVLIAENGKDKLELDVRQLLFIESADNYSSIVFMENENVKKILLRSSLKRIEEQIDVSTILRCHRTFIVNLQNVTRVSGNSQGYRLHFDHQDTAVPVSRTLGKDILEKLKQLQSIPASVS